MWHSVNLWSRVLKKILAKLKDCLGKEKESGSSSASQIGNVKNEIKSIEMVWHTQRGFPLYFSSAHSAPNNLFLFSGEHYDAMYCFKNSYGKFRMIQTLDQDTKEATIFDQKMRFRSMNSMEGIDKCLRFSLNSIKINLTDLIVALKL